MWWGATLTVILAVAHSLAQATSRVFEPRVPLARVTAYTHHMPKAWRDRAHAQDVLASFQLLYKYRVLVFVDDMMATILTPLQFLLVFPSAAPKVCEFLRDFTTRVEGLGDVCSMAAFDLEKHGNVKYGSPVPAPKRLRSRQGKLEKSLVSFATSYPEWRPGWAQRQVLRNVVGGLQGSEASLTLTRSSGLIGTGLVPGMAHGGAPGPGLEPGAGPGPVAPIARDESDAGTSDAGGAPVALLPCAESVVSGRARARRESCAKLLGS